MMKSLTFALGTLVLVVGAVAMLPEAVSAQVRVLSFTKTLPANGANVTFTLDNSGLLSSDLVILEVLADNHPTDDAGLCVNTGGTPVTCTHSDFRFLSLTIDDKPFRPGSESFPQTIGGEDKLAIRPIFERFLSDVRIPVNKGSTVKLTFDTDNGVNAVRIKLTIGVIGGLGATFQ